MAKAEKIIVIGASAGGFTAVMKLVSAIPADLPSAVFVVIHLSNNSSAEIIREHLAKNTGYTCIIPADDEFISAGTLYIAPPQQHMIISDEHVKLIHGPHENRWRPSIDVLFRSAAANYDSRVIGIILSGMLYDGTSGMQAIKRSGGVCIVQEPEEAEYPEMPESVLNNVDVDYRVPLSDMRYILDDLLSQPPKSVPIPEDVKLEAGITERMATNIDEMEKLGSHSNYTCPDCGGSLWLMKNDKIPRYRCHTGHVYTEKLLAEKQTEELEESLWVCVRMLEQRRNLLTTMASRGNGNNAALKEQQLKIVELDQHIGRLKALLVSMADNETDEGAFK
jgi:two-component system chemotaxis response regulator CheB